VPVCKYGEEASISTTGNDDITSYKTVNFPPESFFGQLIQTHCTGDIEPRTLNFRSIFETALSESVHAHVLAGVGMAWLPKSLVQNDLIAKRLTQLANLPSVEMEIIFLTQASKRCSPAINDIWQFMKKEQTQ
jgi:DNA-binding transcriptional LysR family regulator